MTVEQVKKTYSAQPFQPFILHLADGSEIPVPHREFMSFSPSGRTINVFGADDAYNVIDLLLVSHLEFGPSSRANGRRRRV